MLYPIEDTEIWAERYGIETCFGECSGCGISIIADNPFADGELRGFISTDHGCGIEKCLVTFTISVDEFLI